MKYQPPLDGLRALCVIAVFLYHASYGRYRCGNVGVDVFFALSGYLITRILLAEIEARGTVRLGEFYRRRALRLLPALGVSLVLASALWPFFGKGSLVRDLLLPTVFYYGNWRIARGVDIPLMPHTWSLSVEEQFYFVWPWVTIALARWARAHAIAVTATVAVALAATSAALGPTHAEWNYFSTFGRADELLFGACAALAHASPSARTRASIARVARACAWPVALTLVACSLLGLPFGGSATISALASILIVHCAGGESTALNRALERPTLVWIGKRSYGIYLFHLPIITALEPLRTHGVVNWLLVLCARVAATLLLASASHRCVEVPLLALRRRGREADAIAASSRADR